MMTKRLLVAIGITMFAGPVVGQEMPQVDFNGALNDARVTGRMVRQAQTRDSRKLDARRVTSGQAAACANKERYRSEFGASNVKVQKLYRLCRDKGL